MLYLINLISYLFNLWSFALLARVFLSWFNFNPYHPVVRFLNLLTEPILAPLRRVIPPLGAIDITPIVAILLVQLLERVVVTALWNLA
ncbi:MAG: YggT family protein [Anaerolineae bacterium]